jgi:hypothetical protein
MKPDVRDGIADVLLRERALDVRRMFEGRVRAESVREKEFIVKEEGRKTGKCLCLGFGMRA